MCKSLRISDKAQIAYDLLQSKDRRKVDNVISALAAFPESPLLRRKVNKLMGIKNYFVANAGPQYRVIFNSEPEMITIVDIVSYHRLERLQERREDKQ